jgi:hypothetical protein
MVELNSTSPYPNFSKAVVLNTQPLLFHIVTHTLTCVYVTRPHDEQSCNEFITLAEEILTWTSILFPIYHGESM